MAGKRKIHTRTNLEVPTVERLQKQDSNLKPPSVLIPPAVKLVKFGFSAELQRTADFSKYYGIGIDEVTYASTSPRFQ